MNNDKQPYESPKNFDKIIDLYKIKIYEQKIIIDQLKNRLYNEETIKKWYIQELYLRSKL
jgi:hypothetical protein